jgi:type IV secretory pathway TrbF-like protein
MTLETVTKPNGSHSTQSTIPPWNGNAADDNSYKSVFLNMSRQWQESHATYIAREKTWKALAFMALGIAALSCIGMAYIGAQNKMVPYIVAVDKLGSAVAVQRADIASKPDARIIRAQLARWIENVRSLYQDAGAERANFLSAYSMLRKTDAAYNKLNDYFSKDDPFKRAESEGVSVVISTVLPLSEKTWQVQWTENVHSAKGEMLSSTPMQANVTIDIDPPSDETALLKNPAGVYITNFNWSQRL